ncbi:MAG: Fe-S cluster assembly protein SufD [Flammeovirgaceae bacterium TMED290]|nr:MAG: Fe-S cluster assembly protein SufD [Flammeovirgaceae bacterium TMED290]|tara:strand:+ start:18143 stop:19414 length:1272 start_codon:yes stop_codon:yes gene_type:complete
MNITKDLKKLVSKEEDINLKNKKTDILDSLDLTYSLQKEEYKYTPLLKNVEKKFDLLKENKDQISQKSYEEVIKIVNSKFYLISVDGYFKSELSNIPPKIKIKKYSELDREEKYTFENMYQKHDDSKSDFFSSLNSIIHEDCLTISVDSNTALREHITIININENYDVNNYRKMIFCDKGSEISIFERFIDLKSDENFSSSVTEIYQAENSILNYYSAQDFKENYHYNSVNVFQKRDSVSNFFTVSFSGSIVRNNLNICLYDKSCYTNMYGFYAMNDKSLIDNHTSVDHVDENSLSNEHYKGIMGGRSNGVFNGKIFVRKKAQKTNAFQSNNNIILSDKSKVNTKPQLEIWADDVKCSHGCTVGQMDDDAIFYLMSRGISRKDSISLLLSAFSSEIIEKITDEKMKSLFTELIKKQLEKFNDE